MAWDAECRHAQSLPALSNSCGASFPVLPVRGFLYHVWHLGPADFGQYRHLLFALFGLSALGAFYFVPDFLAVRGFAALLLLAAQPLLNAAYMQAPASRLWLVSFVYLAILVAPRAGSLSLPFARLY